MSGRVYFAGAGLSKGMAYPLGAELAPEIILKARSLNRRRRGDGLSSMLTTLEEVLRKYFGLDIGLEDARAAEIRKTLRFLSVAEFFSVVHTLAVTPALFSAQRHSQEDAGLDSRATTLYERLAAATRTYFNEIFSTNVLPADVKSFVDSVRSGKDSVVSFNWDEELDVALTNRSEASDIAYTLRQARARGRILLLKPHGSVGWYDVAQGIGNTPAYFVADQDDRIRRERRRLVTFYQPGPPLDIDGKPHEPIGCPPVIMPPTFSKQFLYEEQQIIWQDVVQVCSRAAEFVFLGYSLPADDYLTRAAIYSGISAHPGRQIRCLFVGLARDGDISNFQRVFPTFTREKNVLEWGFGLGPGQGSRGSRRTLLSLPERIEAALKSATV